jgi:hypothetical protein
VGVAFPIEDDRWLVGLIGWHVDDLPDDDASFTAAVRALPDSGIGKLLDRVQPVTEPVTARLRSNHRRLFERLDRVAAGYVAHVGFAGCAGVEDDVLRGAAAGCAARQTDAAGGRDGGAAARAPPWCREPAHFVHPAAEQPPLAQGARPGLGTDGPVRRPDQPRPDHHAGRGRAAVADAHHDRAAQRALALPAAAVHSGRRRVRGCGHQLGLPQPPGVVGEPAGEPGRDRGGKGPAYQTQAAATDRTIRVFRLVPRDPHGAAR